MRAAFAAAAVCLLAIVVYLPGLPGDFVYDDHRLIVENDGLKRPFDLRRAFLRDYYASDVDRIGLGYYRPLAVLSNELDHRRGGGSSLPFHATNIALHVGCTLLVLGLSLRLLGGSLQAATFAAALFALHPSHAESVAFVSGRVDPLATLFSLAAILLHLAANRAARPWGWRAAAGAAWLAALFSKEVAAVVPGMLLLLEGGEEGWPPRASWHRRAARYLPYAVAAAIYLAARLAALPEPLPLVGEAGGISLGRPLVVVGTYLSWLVLPPPGLHLEPPLPSGAAAALAALIALVGLVGAVALWRTRWRREAALLGACLLALLPVSHLRPLETLVSERFLYLPSACAMVLLGALASRARRARTIAVTSCALAGMTILYGAILLPRVSTWRSELALWQAKEAEEKGGSLKARLNLARAYARRGDRERSERWYEATRRIAPNLGPGLDAEIAHLGTPMGTEEYEAALRKALDAYPEDGALWGNLGFHLLKKRDLAESKDAFARAVTFAPGRATAWLGLALAPPGAREVDRAAEAASRAATLDPQLGMARAVLAESRLRQGRACESLALADGLTLDAPEEQRMLERVRQVALAACPDGASPR